MNPYHPTFYALHPLFEVFLETVGVVILDGVAGPEVENTASGVAQPVVDIVAVAVVLPEVLFVVDLEVSEPGVVFVAPFSIVHVSGRQVSVHIHTASAA